MALCEKNTFTCAYYRRATRVERRLQSDVDRFEVNDWKLRSNHDRYDQGQVERIIGPPTRIDTKDMIIFKRTTYRYEEGAKFALFTFKNDELEDKQGNLAAQR